MNIKKELAVIVLNYNNYEQTINIVNQLNQFDISTVLVDNASTNNSWEILSKHFKNEKNINLIKSETNGGYSKGNNIGIKYAINNIENLKYIAIMNPDIELCDKDTLYKLCSALSKDSNLAGITAKTILNNVLPEINPCADKLVSDIKLIFSNISFITKLFPTGYKHFDANNEGVAYVDKMQGCFFIMKKDIFEQIDFLDESVFLYFEEDILAYKIKKAGYKFGVLTDTYIKHNHIIKDGEMNNLPKRRFHNKCTLESKKYYMLNIRHIPKWMWMLSYILDWSTRFLKDIYIIVFNC